MRILKTKLIGQVSKLAGQVVCRILSLCFLKKLRKTEEEVVHGRMRGWDPYVCYLLNCTLALMTDFESSRCVITTRQEAGCSGKVERELKPMVR